MTTELIVKKDSHYSAEQMALIKSQVAVGCTDLEMQLFLEYAKRTGLDPFSKQIYAIKLGGKMSIQTSIDGLRLVAQRTGEYRGQLGPFWCGEDGKWLDVWLSDKPPSASKVGVLRLGFTEPVWGVARFKSYAGGNLWLKMPETMISKVAESLALRKCFPNEMAGIYESSEMEQAVKDKPMYVQPEASNDPTEAQPDTTYRLTWGKYTGRSLEEIYAADAGAIPSYIDYLRRSAAKDQKPLSPKADEFIEHAGNFLGAMENKAIAEFKKGSQEPMDFSNAPN